jgi:Reverse transcriptase (RNA-dependent DNA polymerase)
MLSSSYKADWTAAADREIAELTRRGTFELIPTQEEQKKTPLPLLWIFKYKFDTDGYLVKFKARLCVRGDLQTTEQDTYAATLAARSFRALMAILAAFDLEIRQYDAVNAFINADMNEEIYCLCPEGYKEAGMTWRLRKACMVSSNRHSYGIET